MSEADYERVPYDSHPLFEVHPERLAVTAALHGLTPPGVERCSVLELGCATGGNLLAMAQELPHARLVGIDYSPTQIEMGRTVAAAAGLTNVELLPRSILDLDASFGTFDYILCHGVYSWVPQHVQEAILSVCRRLLAPGGLAYISFNTRPGIYNLMATRQLMRHRARRFDTPEEQLRAARDVVAQVASSLPAEAAWAPELQAMQANLSDKPDTYVFHEYLEEDSHPLHLEEMAARAGEHGLRYVGESFRYRPHTLLPIEIQRAIESLSDDRLAREQYFDFFTHREFRRSVWCRDEAQPTAASPAALTGMRFMALAMPTGSVDTNPDVAVTFESNLGKWTTPDVGLKRVLGALAAVRPASLSFEQLLAADGVRSAAALRRELLDLVLHNLVLAQVHPPTFSPEPPERPRAPPLSRHLCGEQSSVPTLYHTEVDLDQIERLVLWHLDGQRDQAALVGELLGAVLSGRLQIAGAPTDPTALAATLSAAVAAALPRLASKSLLMV